MPFINITVRRPKTRDFKDTVLDARDAMVVFKETGWENGSFAGGRQIHV